MKEIAFIGAHGTGKTSVFEEIKKIKPEWSYFGEMARVKSKSFGYDNPWEIEKEVGEAVLDVMLVSHFGIIDQSTNPFIRNNDQVLIADRSPVDYFGYYLTERNKDDFKLENFLKKITQYYINQFDLFVYFPVGVIPLIGDEMRPSDVEYQNKVDTNILETIDIFDIPKERVYKLSSIKISERAEEVIKIVESIK